MVLNINNRQTDSSFQVGTKLSDHGTTTEFVYRKFEFTVSLSTGYYGQEKILLLKPTNVEVFVI